DYTAADPSSPGPTSWQDPRTASCRGERRARKRDSSSAESRVRCSLLFSRTTGFRWGLPYLLPTPLHILQEASRVHSGGLKQNAVGGVLLNAPSPLWGSPVFLQGRVRLTWSPMRSHPMEEA